MAERQRIALSDTSSLKCVAGSRRVAPMAGSKFQADRANEPTARAGKARAEPGERVIRDQEGRSMSNNDEYVGRFSKGEEVLGESDPKKHRVGSFADEDLGPADQRSRVLEAS
jgi:hypothetical protein